MIFSVLVHSALLALSFFGDVRTVNVTVSVSGNGAPVVGLPITLRDGFRDSVSATDATGSITIQKIISPHQRWLAVMPRPDDKRSGETEQAFVKRRQSEVAKLREFGFKRFYRLPLVDGQQDYTLSISAGPSRTVTARVVEGGSPVPEALAKSGAGVLICSSDALGVIQLPGFTQSADSLFVSRAMRTTRVAIPAGNTAIDVGDIQIASFSPDSEYAIKVTNWNRLDKTLDQLNDGVTLVSADGNALLGLPTIVTNVATTATTVGAGGPAKIPAGTWYLAPGDFIGTPAQVRLTERLANGESVANIPKIVVVAGQAVDFQFDAVEAEQAIMAP